MFRYLFSRCADLTGCLSYRLDWRWLTALDLWFWTIFPDRWFDQTDGSPATHPGTFGLWMAGIDEERWIQYQAWLKKEREGTDFELNLEAKPTIEDTLSWTMAQTDHN